MVGDETANSTQLCTTCLKHAKQKVQQPPYLDEGQN